MIRKSIFALAAVATMAAAALAPTSASAWGFKGGWHPYHGFGLGIGLVDTVTPSCYLVEKTNRHGVTRTFQVCD